MTVCLGQTYVNLGIYREEGEGGKVNRCNVYKRILDHFVFDKPKNQNSYSLVHVCAKTTLKIRIFVSKGNIFEIRRFNS